MSEEKYVLNCPACGPVEGFIVLTHGEEDDAPPEADMVIEERIVRTPTGPEMRLRCPRCGRWLRGARAHPA